MRRTSGLRAAAGALLLVSGIVIGGTAPPPARAAETPIYNEPAGGGPVTEVVERVGPFELDALGEKHSEDVNVGVVPRPDGAFGLKYATFDLVDENGDPIGHHDVHLHHFVIAAVNKVDPACPDRKEAGIPVQPLIGSGSERTPITFPDPYALMVGQDDLWGATWHLMNMTASPKTVYVEYTLGIQPGATLENTRPLVPFWADSRTCPAGAVWDVPGDGGVGSIETNTKSWEMPFDGYVVGIGGHMHDGGISITTKHEDGSFMCENLASYLAGMIDTISPCPRHDSIEEGERLQVTSRYDNSAPHEDVMGMAVMYLWQGDQGTPPTSTTSTAAPDPSSTSTPTSTSTTTAAAATASTTPRFAG